MTPKNRPRGAPKGSRNAALGTENRVPLQTRIAAESARLLAAHKSAHANTGHAIDYAIRTTWAANAGDVPRAGNGPKPKEPTL